MTIPVPAAIVILALLFVIALMLASLLSAGERTQADIWRQQWATSSDAVRQLTLDVTAARGERDRARATAVYLEQEIADIWAVVMDSEGVAGWHQNGDIATWAELGIGPDAAIPYDDIDPDEGVGLR